MLHVNARAREGERGTLERYIHVSVQSYLPLSKLQKLSKTHLFGACCQAYKKQLRDHAVQTANLNCNKQVNHLLYGKWVSRWMKESPVLHPAMLVNNMLLAGIGFDIHVKVSSPLDPAVLIQKNELNSIKQF